MKIISSMSRGALLGATMGDRPGTMGRRLQRGLIGFLAVLWILGLAPAVRASPGDVDTSYGASGYYLSNGTDESYASLVQPDSKLVIAGRCQSRSGVWNFCVSRLTTGGVLDTTFGAQPTPSGRTVIVAGDANSINEQVVSISRLPDGRIIVGGDCTVGGASQWCLLRLNSNGAVDSTFGTAGRVYIPTAVSPGFNAPSTLTTVKALADGKILLAGNWYQSLGQSRMMVMRLNPNGSTDTSFGSPNGYVLLVPNTPTSGDYRVNALAVQPDNRIVAVGYCERLFQSSIPTSYFTSKACVWFLNSDGSPDGSIPGGSNFATLSISGSTSANANNALNSITVRGDGLIFAGGSCGTSAAPRSCYFAFNPVQLFSGSATGSSTDSARTIAVGQNGDGRMVLLGTLTFSASSAAFGLGQVPADLNASYVGLSNVASPIAGGYNSVDAGGGLQSDGKILLAGNCGTSSLRSCVTRLEGFPVYASVCSLDIDGDGSYNALVDGLILSRVMLGMTGSAVTNGVSFPPGAARSTWSALRLYLVSQCGLSLP